MNYIDIGLDKLVQKEFFYYGYSDSMTKWIGDHCKIIKIAEGFKMINYTKGVYKNLPWIQIKCEIVTKENYPEYFL